MVGKQQLADVVEEKAKLIKKYLVGRRIKIKSDLMRSGMEIEIVPSYMTIRNVFVIMEEDLKIADKRPIFSVGFLSDLEVGASLIGDIVQNNSHYAAKDTIEHILRQYFNCPNVYLQIFTEEGYFKQAIAVSKRHGFTIF